MEASGNADRDLGSFRRSWLTKNSCTKETAVCRQHATTHRNRLEDLDNRDRDLHCSDTARACSGRHEHCRTWLLQTNIRKN